MPGPTIETITCYAQLDDAGEAVDDAGKRSADGDDDMQNWLEDFEHDAACIVKISTVARVCKGDETRELRVDNHGIWMEIPLHPAVAAKQIQEAATKDHQALAEKLRAEGVEVSAADIGHMHVAVEMDDALHELLRTKGQLILPRRPRVAERH